MKSTHKSFDIVVIGGGPAGLVFASSVAQSGMRVCVLEKEPESILKNPAPDGREIALTHASVDMLTKLGVFKHIPAKAVSPIAEAKVIDGSSQTYFLNFSPSRVKRSALGFIVSNHLIRQAAYIRAHKDKNITLIAGADVSALSTGDACGEVVLADGRTFQAPLIVAADGRFSVSRKRMGIAVSSKDFGRTIIVSRLQHEKPHHGIAFECFNYQRTLAMLPLPGNVASAVITLPTAEVDKVMAMSAADFSRDVETRFEGRLGAMKLDGKRHAYPLVAVYANSFVAKRFALLGDAAVGMHPVTAHGFNFGLKGQSILSEHIVKAASLGLDIGSGLVLSEYNRLHRAATFSLYHATNLLVGLFTDERPRAKKLRQAVLHLGNSVRPFKSFVTHYLADAKRAS